MVNYNGMMGMKNESQNAQRKVWERPVLYRMDAADAQGPVMGSGADGMANMS